MQRKLIYEFGPFRFDPAERLLTREERPVSLSPQLFSLLVAFLENPNHLLSKEELRNKVWGKTYVSDHALKVIIGNLRKALGNGGGGDSYIENVRSGGYRFVAPVRKFDESENTLADLPNLPTSLDLNAAKGEPAQHESNEDKPVTTVRPAASAIIGTAPSEALTRGDWKPSRAHLIIALGLFVAATAGLSFVLHYHSVTPRPETAKSTSADLTTRKVIAVLPFQNLSRRVEDAWLCTAFPEWMASELAGGGHLRVVPGDQIAALHRDLAWTSGTHYTREKLEQLSHAFSAEMVLTGAFSDVTVANRQQLRLDLKLLDTSTGQLMASFSETGNRDDIFALTARAGAGLRDRLLLQISPTDVENVRATLPANDRAAKLYIQGLEKLRALDPITARDLLEQAIQADSTYPLAHSALASVWSALGYDGKARAEAGKAMGLASRLSREQCLDLEGAYRETTKDWIKAEQIYQTLSVFAPDNIDYTLRLARVQIGAGHGKAALSALASARQSRFALNDPRIDLLEAKAFESLGDFPHEIQAADQAINLARARKASQLLGNALIAKSWALDNSGRAKEAEAVAREAKDLYSLWDDKSGVGWALMNIANAVSDEGDHAAAIVGYKQALEYFQQTGNEHGVAVAMNNMGFDMKDSGDLDSAKKAFGEAIAVCRKTGDTRAEVLALNGLGTILYRQGSLRAARQTYESALQQFRANGDQDRAARMLRNIALALEGEGELAKARGKFEEAIAIDRQIGSKSELSANLENEGELLLLQGDAVGAKSKLEESEKLSRDVEDKRNLGYALAGMAQILHVRGDLAAARAKYDSAMNLRTQSGEKGLAAETAILLAQFQLDEGNLQEAESLSRHAVDEFTSERRPDEQATALATLADVKLHQGDLMSAKAKYPFRDDSGCQHRRSWRAAARQTGRRKD